MTNLETLSGQRAWIITDGKAGHEAQCLGVAEALGLKVDFRHIQTSRWYRWLAPYAPVPRRERFATADSNFQPPWPSIALSAGRLTAPYMQALKQHAGAKTFTVILLDPKLKSDIADLFWVPAHDQRRGANVITTLAPPHRYSPALLATLRQKPPTIPLPKGNSSKTVVLLGGPSRTYRYTDADIERLIELLSQLRADGQFLLVTGSRRTPQRLSDAVRHLTQADGGYFWDGHGPNPLAEFYAFGDQFIAPGDSINMTAEPCVTGRPVHVFHPSGGSQKFKRFHQALEAYGATRPLRAATDFEQRWSYAPLFASETIADEVTRRWRLFQENAIVNGD